MRTTLLALMFLTASVLQAQATPTPYDCNFATTFNAATATSQSYYNKGPAAPCIAWRLTYNTVSATGVSISLQGTANLANGQPDPAGWTNLTPVQTTVNPALGTNQGSIVACCDYYPWIRVTAGTFTGLNRSMSLTVLGYKGTTAHMLPPGSITGGPFAAGDVITGGGGQAITDSGVLLSALVPYTGATTDVTLGAHYLEGSGLRITGTGFLRLNGVDVLGKDALGVQFFGSTAPFLFNDGNVGIDRATPSYRLDVGLSGASGTARFQDTLVTTGATRVLVDLGAADTATTTTFTNNGTSQTAGLNITGASFTFNTKTCTIVAGVINCV